MSMKTPTLPRVNADRQVAALTGGVTYTNLAIYDGKVPLVVGSRVLVDDGDLEPVEAEVTDIRTEDGHVTLRLVT